MMKLSTVQRKKFRVRNKLKRNASSDRYRLSVSRSLKNFSAQIIDDVNNKTLLSASSIEKDIKNGNMLIGISPTKNRVSAADKSFIHKKKDSPLNAIVFLNTIKTDIRTGIWIRRGKQPARGLILFS